MDTGGPTHDRDDHVTSVDPNVLYPIDRAALPVNDYRFMDTAGVENRAYILSSGTKWVKVWVDWWRIQGQPQGVGSSPGSQAASWAQINQTGQLLRLDRQIRAINNDGLGVLLTVFGNFPDWATGQTAPEPCTGKAVMKSPPSDQSSSGPWAWFISHLLCRYKLGAGLNPTGPSDTNIYGNPYGAAISALEIVNEPNYLWWQGSGGPGCVLINLIKSAEALATFFGWPQTGQWLMFPALRDKPDVTDKCTTSGSVLRYTDWYSVADGVLSALQGWQPRLYVGWSHHNYTDVGCASGHRSADCYGGGGYRADVIKGLLQKYGWTGGGPPGWQDIVWLTEGGYISSSSEYPNDEPYQNQGIAGNYLAMGSYPMWTQHDINNLTGDTFKSGLRDDATTANGSDYVDGKARSAYSTWSALQGSPTP